ncbi:bifunctional adenosylcobinamide kinase/adenosylcobinamide-phosphate guanylyltransferase [Eggerthellaceae bacterium zg-997]|nr:bifunctional adenosylcobinamide kinase/adenosylcobinamide-phosphate guanylyltransferase [Eggerthellaceae bacterium zg-997]
MIAFVTGGAASGKSMLAERIAASHPGPRVYLATMRAEGAEALARIERHRLQRAHAHFTLVERPCGVDDAALPADAAQGCVLLEDLGNLVANEMFPADGPPRDADETADAVTRQVVALERRCALLVVVSPEAGAGTVEPGSPTEAYLRALGTCACRVAARATEAHLCVAGASICLKGVPR